jgi:hypothetical protein
MVMTMAGTAVANEAARDRGNGDSLLSTAFKFGILALCVLLLVAILIGLWLFNNWAGIIDFGTGILDWAWNGIGGLWGGLTGGVPALGSWLFSSPTESIKRELSSVRGIDVSSIV